MPFVVCFGRKTESLYVRTLLLFVCALEHCTGRTSSPDPNDLQSIRPHWVSRNTAPRASRAPRRNTCLGFNWISRKCGGNVEETLNTSNGARKGETSSYPPFVSASSAVRAVYAVRCFVTPHSKRLYVGPKCQFAPVTNSPQVNMGQVVIQSYQANFWLSTRRCHCVASI